MKNLDSWLTHDPAGDHEDVFCSACGDCCVYIDDADEDGRCSIIRCPSCHARERGEISSDLVTDIIVGGIDPKDAPDFVDAFIQSARWHCVPKGVDDALTPEQLDRLEISSAEIFELVQKKLF